LAVNIYVLRYSSKITYQKPKEPAVVGNERKHLAEASQNYQVLDMPRNIKFLN
jgi:hypothetical protein